MSNKSIWVKLKLKSTQFKKKAKESKEALAELGKTAAKGMAIAAAAFAVGSAAVAAFVLHQAEATEEVHMFAQALGVSSSALQQMAGVTRKFGLDTAGLRDGLEDLRERIGEGLVHATGEAKEAWEKMGNSMESLRGKSVNQQFEEVLGSLSEVEDVSIRSAFAMQLFGGEAGKAMLAVSQDAKAMEDLFKSLDKSQSTFGMDDEDIARLAAINAATVDLKDSATSLFSRLGSEVGPSVVALFEGLRDVFIEIREEFFDGSLSGFLEDQGPEMIALFLQMIEVGVMFASEVGAAIGVMFGIMGDDSTSWLDTMINTFKTVLLFFATFKQSLALGFLNLGEIILKALLFPMTNFIKLIEMAIENAAVLAFATGDDALGESLMDTKHEIANARVEMENFELAPDIKRELQKEMDEIAVELENKFNVRKDKAAGVIKRVTDEGKKAAEREKEIDEPKVESLFEQMTRLAAVGIDKSLQWAKENKTAIDGLFKPDKAAQKAKGKVKDDTEQLADLVTRGSAAEKTVGDQQLVHAKKQTDILTRIAEGVEQQQFGTQTLNLMT